MKKRAALCISGHFRSYKDHISALKKFVLNNENIEYDIFIHTWSIIDRNSEKLQKDEVIKQYNPKLYVIQDQIIFYISDLMKDKNFNCRDINGLLSMFYKIQQCNELKTQYEIENNFTYDYVVRFRADVELTENFLLHEFDNNKLFIPLHGDYKGINDQFAFGNSSLMNLYSSTFSNIEKYLLNMDTLNPEYLNKYNITINNLIIERPKIDYIIRWSNGSVWNNETRFPIEVMKKHGFI